MKDFLVYYCIGLASLILFLHGFFPIQQNQASKQVSLPNSLNDIKFNKSLLYKQEINRIVLIVIDALRLDFINEKNVPFITSAYHNHGCILTVNVQSPTVTLPRIKALTTGNIPQFIDVILNLASTEILSDSFLHKAHEVGKKIVFYGDDTWIKLYPNIFTRYEGVSSFYVNDYTEVDYNVTRNVIKELNDNEDWDIMLLHYLGLDHIGHVYGPYSHLIQPKLKEMDDIVKKIFESLKIADNKTLIVVTGDHGMKDSGGHGGSTFSETHVPFVSIGVPCKDDTVAQTDIPATLASLLGLPHPSGSIGCVISNMLISFSLERLLYILHYNTMFLKSKMNECGELFNKAAKLHYNFLKTAYRNDANEAKSLYENCSKEIRDKLVHSSVEQDVHSLMIGSIILIVAFCIILYKFISKKDINTYFTKIFTVAILVLEMTIPKLPLLRNVFVVSLGVIIFYYFTQIIRTIKWKPNCDVNSCVVIASIVYCFSLLSSSFIEEEHQVWYFFFSTLILLNCYLVNDQRTSLQWLTLLLVFRIIKTINQTGDKWAHLPDLKQWLLLEQNNFFLHILYFSSLILTLYSVAMLGIQKKTLILNIITLILICVLNLYSSIQNIILVKIIWFLILLNICFAFIQNDQYLEHVIIIWTLFCTILMRPYNVILLPICIIISHLICKQINNVKISTLIHIWLGRTLFFCQGHSNSLASIDIASGYVGIQEYIPFIVIMQVLCHTYTFPVLTNLLLLKNYTDTVWKVNILCRLMILVVTCITILIHQQHLFVWTVFAPKLLIESCHTAVLFLELFVYYCVKNIKSIIVNFK